MSTNSNCLEFLFNDLSFVKCQGSAKTIIRGKQNQQKDLREDFRIYRKFDVFLKSDKLSAEAVVFLGLLWKLARRRQRRELIVCCEFNLDPLNIFNTLAGIQKRLKAPHASERADFISN